ncbi:hypothetical protein LBMAG47_24010 [Planctomycetia bacterium]|jgi:hypothetical protein|nr:hypothetical protein LBMAG47_24010 [Planctomycetia bacterium]
MSIDAIDAAFLGRWGQDAGPPSAVHASDSRPEPLVAAHGQPVPACVASSIPEPTPASVMRGSVLEQLLAAARPQWNRLAETVEGARSRGRRVIAVTGAERGEGRSTLVAGLVHVLRARGRDVVEIGPEQIGGSVEPTHDKRIVIVDAGIWFPPGPIRRQRLIVASLGCEAAILVRRADRQPAPAREVVLESLGIEVLGEVVSFAPASEPMATA